MIRKLISALVAGMALLCAATAQDAERLKVQAKFVPERATPGQQVELRLEGEISPGYHVYGALEPNSDPISIAFHDTGPLQKSGETVVPPGVKYEPFAGYVSFWISDSIVMTQQFTVPSGAADGAITVHGQVDYMACTEAFCEPVTKAPFTAVLTIGDGKVAGAAAGAGAGAGAGAKMPAAFGAADADEDAELRAVMRFDPPKAKAGQEFDVVIEVEVDAGWHVYGALETVGSPIRMELEDVVGIESVGEQIVPPGEAHEAFGQSSYWIEGKFEIRQRMRVEEGESEGLLQLGGTLHYMVCDESKCLPPAKLELSGELEVLGEGAEEQAITGPIEMPRAPTAAELAAAKETARANADPNADMGSIGWGALLLLALSAGLLALVMPCTYPMIPITFSFFTKQADARGGKVLSLALVYGLGIVTMFVVIGLFFAPWIQSFALHPITNLVIAVLFIVFAFALFGLINLEPPRQLQDFAGKASMKGGYFGVFLMGLCLVITSFTCTVPFVGTMLALSAAGGTGKVIGGMAMFGLTLAVPFVALALLPGRVRALPRAGEWMNTLKVTLGFVELAAALKFISNVDVGWLHDDFVISRQIFLAIWIVIFLATALYLFGVFSKGVRVGQGRLIGGLLFVLLTGYCVFTLVRPRVDFVMAAILPPSRVQLHEVVPDDWNAAVARARAQDKLLLVNFTGFN